MKIVNNKKDNKDRVLMATNFRELELIFGAVEKVRLHLPKNMGTAHDHSRLKNIQLSIGNFLKEYKRLKSKE